MELLLKATIETAVDSKAIKPKELERVIVDSTEQDKAIAHPTDSRLLDIARRKLVSAAKRLGLKLKQTFDREGSELRGRAGGYAHAEQFKRPKKVPRRQRTGAQPNTVVVDADNPGVQIIHRGKFKSLTALQRRWLKRRQAIEPAIGHTKADHRMDRCYQQSA